MRAEATSGGGEFGGGGGGSAGGNAAVPAVVGGGAAEGGAGGVWGPRLAVGGYVGLTTVDFPGRLAAVVFLRGCPWRCPYCHNAHLREFGRAEEGQWAVVRERLARRRGVLDGVVFSGGEPTGQGDLGAAMREVKGMGFEVGLHTGGAYPEGLREVLQWTDWVGLDVKAPPDERYDAVCGRRGAAEVFLRSLEAVRQSGVAFTLRTTVHPAVTSERDWKEIVEWARREGLPEPVRQEAREVRVQGPSAGRGGVVSWGG